VDTRSGDGPLGGPIFAPGFHDITMHHFDAKWIATHK